MERVLWRWKVEAEEVAGTTWTLLCYYNTVPVRIMVFFQQ